MNASSEKTNAVNRRCAAAILLLRIFIGGVMLLHIIGNMQDYGNLSESYRPVLGLSPATSLAVATIAEGLFAAMIILGVGTRFAAVAMIVVLTCLLAEAVASGAVDAGETKYRFVCLGIYVALAVSGGGAYAFDLPPQSDKNVQKR